MGLEVDYITLGDASERLETPAPTLRNWTDQLEDFNVHYVLRNNRNERIYEESDLKVFEFLRDLKNEYGRKTTTRDLGYMIAEKGRLGELKLRSREDAPIPQPSNRTADLLSQEDLKQIIGSDRARQLIAHISEEVASNLKKEFKDSVQEVVREELAMAEKKGNSTLIELQEDSKKKELEYKSKIEELEKQVEELKTKKEPKGFLQKLFG